ncbi:MAG: CoA-binding protein [Candidatus Viridilinea halotolerans]|uniref:CoA-binding protein n=1 Tax=Candidatus Viridilinea halotolerans TaxID=2491704 RepID=A0A426TQU4_9CHLR|nr:MAG: CoA-binding protein [Candidatus Viridilinea halotolerans]
MSNLDARIADFLAQRRIAVAGLSTTRSITGNLIYKKLKGAGYDLVPIMPKGGMFEGAQSYPDLAAVPGKIDGLFIATRPEVTTELVRQAVAAGVPRIWMHESLAKKATSVSPAGVAIGREHGISVIAGACPMMYVQPVDLAHRCMCWLMKVTKRLPE